MLYTGEIELDIKGKLLEIDLSAVITKKAGGSYKGIRMVYRDVEGSLKEQCMHENITKYNKEAAACLNSLIAGDDFIIVKEKEGEFWNVKSIRKDDGSTTNNVADSSKAATSTGSTRVGAASTAPRTSTYETPEERAVKQIYIVRQSSISAAINFFNGDPRPVEDVLRVAKQFEDFVFGKDTEAPKEVSNDFSDMEDDIL